MDSRYKERRANADDLRPKDQRRQPRAVIAIETGERFESVQDAASSVKCTDATIYSSAGSDGYYSAGGLHWIYADRQDFLGIQGKDIVPPNRGVPRRRVINLDTQEVFDSTILAAKSVDKGHQGSIVRAIQRGIKHKGYRWAYYDETPPSSPANRR